MKKLLLTMTVFSLSLSFHSFLLGQATFPVSKAYDHIASRYQLDQHQVGELRVTDQYVSEHNQVTHVYLAQTHKGYEIFGANITLAILPDGRVTSVGHQLKSLDKVTFVKGDVNITPAAAIQSAAPSLGIASRAASTLQRITAKGLQVYSKADVSHQDIPVSIAYVPVSPGVYQLAYKMQIESVSDGILYQSYVNATTGESIANDKLTLRCSFDDHYLGRSHECDDHAVTTTTTTTTIQAPPAPPSGKVAGTYRALVQNAESPNHGSFELLVGIEDSTASPFGWHDDNGTDGAEYTFTRGNNVNAFLDRNWDYFSDRDVDGTATLTFDFPFNADGNPTDNQDASATNLFVRNNFMHDFTFGYGFNEIAGNFQARNYTGLGAGNDNVNAHAQFGDDNTLQCGEDTNGGTECINNADFATPIDGFSGRMRMFVWNQDNSSKLLDILQPIDLAGKIITGLANFGPDITTEPVTGPVVIVDDGTSDGSKGCNTLEGQDLTGKIAMIDRGLCDFSLKTWNAQQAGAIGVIVCNFEDVILPMGPGDMATEITIPAVLISSVECDRIRLTAGSGLVASLVAQQQGGATFRDGSLDNGIIAHEYGHGISTRLTGGPGNSSCLGSGLGGNGQEASGMGEGWSDFFALVTSAQPGDTPTKRRGIGTYSIKEGLNGRGIRTFPYTTDMNVNSHTYDDIVTEGAPHGVGSVWAAMLWDLYWAFSDEYGWDPDPIHGTGGNNTAIQLVMDGLKLQDCWPSFTNARDAILLADTINNSGVNSCLIWRVFARRGLGSNAEAGDPHSRGDGIEGFDVPKSCLDEVRFTKDMTREIKAGDNIDVTIKLVNYKDFPLTNVAVEDPIPAGTSYLQGSGSIAPTVGNSLVWSIPSIPPDGELTITYQLTTSVSNHSLRLHYDDMEGVPEERYDVYYDVNGTATNFWYPQDALFHSGQLAWSVGDVDTESEHFMQNYEPYEITGDYPVYRFWHYYNTETGADGGFLEITTDDGESWAPLANHMFRNTYPRLLQYTTFAIPNLYAFSGLSSPTLDMIPVYIDLSDYIGETVKIRYRFGSDDNIGGDGWYVDDVEIMDAIIFNSEACVSSDENITICAVAPERGTIVDTEIIIATEGEQGDFAFTLTPNPANDVIQMIMSTVKNEPAHYAVYDLTGQLIQAGKWELTEGVNQKVINLSSMPSGMYVAQVLMKNGMISEKFIKE